MPTACAQCGQPLVRKAQGARYCSHACYCAASRDRAAETLVARFWAHVNKTPTCWFWTASTTKGYGQFHLPRTGTDQHTTYAHRFAWILRNGPIADHLSVLHHCDTPRCVNPDHMFLGTQAENLADARQKGRLVDGRHLIKLSDADLAHIQAAYQPRRNGKVLAAEYGVTLGTIMRVVAGTQRVTRPVERRSEVA